MENMLSQCLPGSEPSKWTGLDYCVLYYGTLPNGWGWLYKNGFDPRIVSAETGQSKLILFLF